MQPTTAMILLHFPTCAHNIATVTKRLHNLAVRTARLWVTFAHINHVPECNIYFPSLSISLNQHKGNRQINLGGAWTNILLLSMFWKYLPSFRKRQGSIVGLGRDNWGIWGGMDPCMVYDPYHGKGILSIVFQICGRSRTCSFPYHIHRLGTSTNCSRVP